MGSDPEQARVIIIISAAVARSSSTTPFTSGVLMIMIAIIGTVRPQTIENYFSIKRLTDHAGST